MSIGIEMGLHKITMYMSLPSSSGESRPSSEVHSPPVLVTLRTSYTVFGENIAPGKFDYSESLSLVYIVVLLWIQFNRQ